MRRPPTYLWTLHIRGTTVESSAATVLRGDDMPSVRKLEDRVDRWAIRVIAPSRIVAKRLALRALRRAREPRHD